jgi:electron transport complex protein RnfD
MYGVLIALIPAFLVSLYCFGLGALIVTLVAVTSCLLCEYLVQRFLFGKEPTIRDGSAILTGVLLAFNLPSNLPVWIIIIGAFVAIGIGKMSFGGLGNNIFNPALVGRVFLLISFPAQMTTWPVVDGSFPMTYLDAQTGATTLTAIHHGHELAAIGRSAIGLTGGSLGEISEIALLLGLVFMLFRKIITWHIPVSILGTVAVFTGLLFAGTMLHTHYTAGTTDWQILMYSAHLFNPLIHLTSGGLMLGAVFMATDYVTSPMSKKGMVVYGIGIGVITVLIRIFGAYPEGMSFAILIMNALTPLINTYIKPKHFGGK